MWLRCINGCLNGSVGDKHICTWAASSVEVANTLVTHRDPSRIPKGIYGARALQFLRALHPTPISPAFLAGSLAVTIGGVLRLYCMSTLGKYWSLSFATQAILVSFSNILGPLPCMESTDRGLGSILCLDVHHSTSSGGQDAPACTGKRLGELGEEGEVPIAPWGLLITYILSVPRGCFFVVRDWCFMVSWVHCTCVINQKKDLHAWQGC